MRPAFLDYGARAELLFQKGWMSQNDSPENTLQPSSIFKR